MKRVRQKQFNIVTKRNGSQARSEGNIKRR